MVAKPQRFKLLLFIYSATCNLYTKADISKTVKLWESEWMICGKAEHRYSEELQINNITQSVWFELKFALNSFKYTCIKKELML